MTKKFLTPVVLPADPAAPMEAAPKQYVDTKQKKLPKPDLAGQLLGTLDASGDYLMWVNPPDEVYVGPAQPTDSWYELWYDTDETTPPTPEQSWNSAWGVVGMGSFTATSFNVYAVQRITNYISFTSVVGRRYRITFNIRAGAGAASAGYFATTLWDGDSNQWTNQVLTYEPVGQFNSVDYSWYFTGDGVTRAWNVKMSASVASTIYTAASDSSFYIEDIGPVSGAVPTPNPTPAWLPLPLAAGWTNYGGGFRTPRYRKEGDRVWVEGFVAATSQPQATLVATLPVGYRPPENLILSAWGFWTPTGFGGQQGAVRVEVYADGTIGMSMWSFPTGSQGAEPVNWGHLTLDFSFSVTP